MPSGDQSPILTVFGNPPTLIRVDSEEHLHLAQAIANQVGRILVVTPSRTIAAERATPGRIIPTNGTHPTPLVSGTQGGFLQADQYAPPSNGTEAQAPAGMCPRCGGTGQTSRGTVCPVCSGRKVTR